MRLDILKEALKYNVYKQRVCNDCLSICRFDILGICNICLSSKNYNRKQMIAINYIKNNELFEFLKYGVDNAVNDIDSCMKKNIQKLSKSHYFNEIFALTDDYDFVINLFIKFISRYLKVEQKNNYCYITIIDHEREMRELEEALSCIC